VRAGYYTAADRAAAYTACVLMWVITRYSWLRAKGRR
jgi:hypothetical protein